MAFLFHRISPTKVLQGLENVSLIPYIFFVLTYLLAFWGIDSWSQSKVISRFSHRVSFREMLPLRAVSSVLFLLHFHAGQAGLAYFLNKTKGLNFFKTYGAIVFVMAVDLYLMILLALIATFFVEDPVTDFSFRIWVRWVAFVALVAFFLHFAFWRRWISFPFADWIRGRHLFQAFHHADLLDYLRVALYRLPMHLMGILLLWANVHFFGAHLSWIHALAMAPLIGLIIALPLTPAGLGTGQLATVELLKDRITLFPAAESTLQAPDLLLAMSLTFTAVFFSWKILLGICFWMRSPLWGFQKKPKQEEAVPVAAVNVSGRDSLSS